MGFKHKRAQLHTDIKSKTSATVLYDASILLNTIKQPKIRPYGELPFGLEISKEPKNELQVTKYVRSLM